MSHMGITLLAIAFGGALGALGRFGLSNYFNAIFQVHHTVYLGTMLVNILGSFAMGLVYVFILEKEILHPQFRSVLMVGFLGAFTTFSSFSLEAINFFEQGHPGLAFAYVVGSVLLCILAAWLAIYLARGVF